MYIKVNKTYGNKVPIKISSFFQPNSKQTVWRNILMLTLYSWKHLKLNSLH